MKPAQDRLSVHSFSLEQPDKAKPQNTESYHTDRNPPYDAKGEATEKVKTFCGETTAHGIGHTVKDDTWTAYRIAWLCIFIAAIGGNCYHLYTVIDGYLKYPTAEVVQVNTVPPPFPHVTLCNQMAASQSETNDFLADPSSHLSQYVAIIQQNEDAFEAYKNETGTVVEDIMLSPTGVFNNLDEDEVSEIGHKLEDFILYCAYAGIECDLEEDFEKVMDSAYFNCYVFTGKKVTKNRDIGSGPSHGLSLIFYLEAEVDGNPYNYSAFRYNRYSYVQNSVGVRLEIHDGDELPAPQDAGFDVMPGHSTSFAIQATEIEKQPDPYGNCTERKKLRSIPKYKYSSARCLDECAADFVFDKCGCATAIYPITKDIKKRNFQYCAKFDNDSGMTTDQLFDNLECERNHLLRFSGKQRHRHTCGCFEPCDYIIYDETISESRWPAPLYIDDMFEEFVVDHSNSTYLKAYQQLYDIYLLENRTAEFQELVYHNFARVNVYFRDVLIIDIKQSPIYDAFTLLANIGGTIGLWAGLSLITLVEIGFFTGGLIRVLITKCKNRNRIQT